MRSRRITGLLTASTLVCGVVVFYFAHEKSLAEDSLVAAQELLETPFDQAPELHDLPIEAIVAQLAEAEAHGATPSVALRSEMEAFEYWAAGDLIFAEGALTAARQAEGWTVRRRLLAAAIARGRANLEEAWEHAREASALRPESQRALLMTTDLALDRHDSGAATRAIRRLVIEAPRVAIVQNRLGLTLELTGDLEGAERAFERAVDLDNDLDVAWINIGRHRRRRGELEQAQTAFQTARELSPGESDAWLGLGLTLMDLGDFEDAQESLEHADELAPHGFEAVTALGDLAAAENRLDDAIDAYRRSLERRENAAGTWVKLGNTLARGERLGLAEPAFREALRHDPELAAAHNGLGSTLARRGHPEEAMIELARAAELDQADPNPLLNLALLHERAGAPDDARAAWLAALARDPSVQIARRRLAQLETAL